jgi:hypothetical protein
MTSMHRSVLPAEISRYICAAPPLGNVPIPIDVSCTRFTPLRSLALSVAPKTLSVTRVDSSLVAMDMRSSGTMYGRLWFTLPLWGLPRLHMYMYITMNNNFEVASVHDKREA